MSLSLKTLPHIEKYNIKKDILFPITINRANSVEKSPRHISLKNLFYQHENTEKNKSKIKPDLQILNYIAMPSEKKTSVKTAITYKEPEFNYNLCMIQKYDENLNTSLSFISEFDLEKEDEKSLNESFISSDEENNCEEQIEIKVSTKKLFTYVDEENDIEFENDWKDIEASLLSKK